MLYGIPKALTPELLKILMEMGHADTIVLVDANYPAESHNERVIYMPGIEVSDLLLDIIRVMPVDTFVKEPFTLMSYLEHERRPEIWSDFELHIKEQNFQPHNVKIIDRYDFYDLSESAYAIVKTGTTARYANIAIQKGVI